MKTKEDTQRELLDTELDLITKQQEGADTSEIQKKLLELRARVAQTRGRGRGARRFTPIVSRHLLSKNNLSKLLYILLQIFWYNPMFKLSGL